jgi:hypothetical protein
MPLHRGRPSEGQGLNVRAAVTHFTDLPKRQCDGDASDNRKIVTYFQITNYVHINLAARVLLSCVSEIIGGPVCNVGAPGPRPGYGLVVA